MHTAWIDARHPMSHQRLWGLTLLERNLRELHRLGIRRVSVLVASKSDFRETFCHNLPSDLEVTWERGSDATPPELLATQLRRDAKPLLVLEANTLIDRRVLKMLLSSSAPKAVFLTETNGAAVAVVTSSELDLFADLGSKNLSAIIVEAARNSRLPALNLAAFDPHIKSLRRRLPPFLIRVEDRARLQEADRILRLTVHKGVNDFVAKYIHPPLEFGLTKLLACTRVTPNQVTLLWVILAGFVIALFATGHLLPGALLAAACGVLDGVDGKLARLTLRFSKGGDLLDHVSNTLYDGAWYLALGWHFSSGHLASTAGKFTVLLLASYCVERIVPGLFQKLHGNEIYDYAKIDQVMRLVGSRMNNNIWLLLIGIAFGRADLAFYVISLWMLATASWHTFRLFWVTWKQRVRKPVLES